jgi:hypothetical protein
VTTRGLWQGKWPRGMDLQRVHVTDRDRDRSARPIHACLFWERKQSHSDKRKRFYIERYIYE